MGVEVKNGGSETYFIQDIRRPAGQFATMLALLLGLPPSGIGERTIEGFMHTSDDPLQNPGGSEKKERKESIINNTLSVNRRGSLRRCGMLELAPSTVG